MATVEPLSLSLFSLKGDDFVDLVFVFSYGNTWRELLIYVGEYAWEQQSFIELGESGRMGVKLI